MPQAIVATALAALIGTACLYGQANENWSAYLGDKHSSQYSTLDQITTDNVANLELAWRWDGGQAREDNRSQIQCNPLAIDGIVYGTNAQLNLYAIDGATGEQLWEFIPNIGDSNKSGLGVNRGLAYWENGKERRILFGVGRSLFAINPEDGTPYSNFASDGQLDLGLDLGRDTQQLSILSNTPGAIYKNLIVVPLRLSEGYDAAPGHIRAYDVRTGKLAWRFNTIPEPGEFGYETWPKEAWKTIGGANVWTGITVDEERGLVFCPTGSAAYDFWGGNRAGDNLFANCLIALDANTGKRVWHHQFVKHDLWDRDLPASPNLVTIERDGKRIDAVAQITKSGHVFIFDRETGEPLNPIEEIQVPWSDLPGEVSSPTQGLPTTPEPFARQLLTADELNDITPQYYREALDRFSTLRPHSLFMPPSKEGTIVFPGFDGGGEWGGAAVDPQGILYINSNEMPWILTMLDTKKGTTIGAQFYLQSCAGCHGADKSGNAAQNVPSLVDIGSRLPRADIETLIRTGRGVMPSFGFALEKELTAVVDHLLSTEDQAEGPIAGADERPYNHTGYNRWLVDGKYPAVKPPWGTLNAIDLNTGEYLWKTTLGEFPELTAKGIPPTGTENYGGPVVTAGGLLFIAASKDEHIRAFDTSTGKELWKYTLPAGGYATPATYSVHGTQYIVIACGGGKMGTQSGDSYLAFALPAEN